MVITIVGGGATALAFLYNYLAATPAESTPATTIYLVEKRGVFGPGAAYAPDVSSNILNTKTGFITPFHDRPGDFLDWLTNNQAAWRRSFPHFDLDPDGYAPRPLFGMYMQAKMAWIVKQALMKNVRIIQVDAEVKDITVAGAGYATKTDCSLSLTSDYVFLCCGTLSAKRSPFAGNPGRILANPYPIDELPLKIPPHANVGIIGARLSCIDTVVGLIESGHKGHIAIHSRSGYFPSVRGTQGRITPQLLTAANVEKHVRINGKLTIPNLVQLVMHEISLISDNVVHTALPLPPAPPKNIEAFLTQEIELASAPRPWQAVLYSTNAIIDQLWAALDDKDKADFLANYFSAFMSYRVSIPVENAKKILAYLKSGRLSFHAGAFTVSPDADGRPTIFMDTEGTQPPLVYDYVINATGSSRSVTELDSNLLENLLQRGMVTPHRFGGIAIDSRTYQVIGASGTNARLYAMGELTVGTFFFTSALDINARHARICATNFAESVREKTQVDPQTFRLKQG